MCISNETLNNVTKTRSVEGDDDFISVIFVILILSFFARYLVSGMCKEHDDGDSRRAAKSASAAGITMV